MGQQVVERRPQGEEIGAGVALRLAELLRRGVAARAQHERIATLAAFEAPGDAEVNQLDPAGCLVEHDVFRLQVAVDDGWVARMQEGQHPAQLRPPIHHVLLRQRPAVVVEQLAQRPPLDQFHDQEVAVVELEHVGHTRQILVVQRAQQLRFLVELSHRLGAVAAGQGRLAHLFHGPTRDIVEAANFVNRAHAALGDEAQNEILVVVAAGQFMAAGHLAGGELVGHGQQTRSGCLAAVGAEARPAIDRRTA